MLRILGQFSDVDSTFGLSTARVQHVRGDKTPIEVFIAGRRGWETGIRRQIEGNHDFGLRSDNETQSQCIG